MYADNNLPDKRKNSEGSKWANHHAENRAAKIMSLSAMIFDNSLKRPTSESGNRGQHDDKVWMQRVERTKDKPRLELS